MEGSPSFYGADPPGASARPRQRHRASRHQAAEYHAFTGRYHQGYGFWHRTVFQAGYPGHQRTDKAIGSVHYISPEQARGEITDEKADIYSVGVMLYEMLTGRLPFEADNAVSVAIMQLQSEPQMPRDINPSIPEGLEEITIKAMQKDPSKRYQSAAEMLQDIEEFKRNPSIHFEYTYFKDETPTRFVEAITKVKGEPLTKEEPGDCKRMRKTRKRNARGLPSFQYSWQSRARLFWWR